MLICLALVVAFGGVPAAKAHTAFSGSSPDDGEVLSAPPERLHLSFSGKLEASLHSVKLAGPGGAPVVSLEPLVLSEDRKTIMANFPELANGEYTVTFRVISGDGHPIEGAVSFEVDAPVPEPGSGAGPETEPEQEAEAGQSSEAEQGSGSEREPTAESGSGQEAAIPSPEGGVDGEGQPSSGGDLPEPHEAEAAPSQSHSDGRGHSGAYASSGFAILLFASRILYYAALLSLLGWALWSALQRRLTGDRSAYWRRIGLRLLAVHLLAFGLFVAVHWLELTGGGESGVPLAVLLRDTGIGQSWLFTALLGIAGFPLLFRYRYIDAGWAVLVIAAKTLRGHASAFEPVLWARIADGVHLASAGIWAGGLLAMVLVMKTSREWFREFAPAFSAAAFAALIVLAVTGTVSAILYTGELSDLPRTAWGILLLGKIALVALVVPVAAWLRRKLRQGDDISFRKWIKLDFALLLGIVAATGVLTHISPTVERVSFNWHVMGTEVHITADMEDVRAGANELSLKVWVPQGDEAPAVSVVVVETRSGETPVALAAMDVPSEEWETFGDLDKYTFTGVADIAEPEEATLIVRVQRSDGQQYEYSKRLSGT